MASRGWQGDAQIQSTRPGAPHYSAAPQQLYLQSEAWYGNDPSVEGSASRGAPFQQTWYSTLGPGHQSYRVGSAQYPNLTAEDYDRDKKKESYPYAAAASGRGYYAPNVGYDRNGENYDQGYNIAEGPYDYYTGQGDQNYYDQTGGGYAGMVYPEADPYAQWNVPYEGQAQEANEYVYYDQYGQPVQYDAYGNAYDYYGQPVQYDYYGQIVPNYYEQQGQQYGYPQQAGSQQQAVAVPEARGASVMGAVTRTPSPPAWEEPVDKGVPEKVSEDRLDGTTPSLPEGRAELYIEATIPRRSRKKKKERKLKPLSDSYDREMIVERLLSTTTPAVDGDARLRPVQRSGLEQKRAITPPPAGSEVIVYPSQYPEWISSVVAASAMDAENATAMPTAIVHTAPAAMGRQVTSSAVPVPEDPSRLWAFKRRARCHRITPPLLTPDRHITTVTEVPGYPRPVSVLQVPPRPVTHNRSGPATRRYEVIPVMHTAPASCGGNPAAHNVVLSGFQGVPVGRRSCFPCFREGRGSRHKEILVRPFVQTLPAGVTVSVGKPRVLEVKEGRIATGVQEQVKPTSVRFVNPLTHETTAAVKVIPDVHTSTPTRQYNVMLDGKKLHTFVQPSSSVAAPIPYNSATGDPLGRIGHQTIRVASSLKPSIISGEEHKKSFSSPMLGGSQSNGCLVPSNRGSCIGAHPYAFNYTQKPGPHIASTVRVQEVPRSQCLTAVCV